ncbi:hypothetical protein MRX96_012151 [Rhipicephalus microplus]
MLVCLAANAKTRERSDVSCAGLLPPSSLVFPALFFCLCHQPTTRRHLADGWTLSDPAGITSEATTTDRATFENPEWTTMRRLISVALATTTSG